MSKENEKITLGSGKLYTAVFAGAIPSDKELETEANLLGLIEGGAALEYKPKFVEVSDDLGLVAKTILTEEEVTLKSGIMTWNGKTLAKLCTTARVTEVSGKRTVKIGGVGNQDGKQYVIRFVHEDAVDGDVRVTIVGSNQAGFKMAFTKDKATIVDAEFKAAPLDDVGTKIIYEESIPGAIEALMLTSVAGTLSGATKVAVTPVLTAGNSYMYKTATTVLVPELNDICDTGTGYTVWNGTVDITATTGNEIEIIEVDGTFKAIKAGKIAVVAKV
ncbi:MAG: hypothetical protein ACREV6_19450 [Clostridium sp.]|uniref:hypothetical protein n=1 Tax=Clostridium sp. TaxID=1506 RepID=UPI003D6D5C53